MRTRSSATSGTQLNLEDSFLSAASDTEIEIMTFETENGTDEAGAHSKLSSVKVAYDPKDVEFFFINLESAMAYSGIKSQQTKRFCLLWFLPKEVKTQFKGVITATATGQQGYKQVKDAVLEVFGPKPGYDFAKAARLMLTDYLTIQLFDYSMLEDGTISLDCSHATPLQNCCCEGADLNLGTRQLSEQDKSRIPGKSIEDPAGLKEVLKTADAVHTTNSQRAHQVVAVKFSRQGGATQARPNGATAQLTQYWSPRHPDNPPDGCCRVHWRWGTKAYFCSDSANCPWVKRINPRPQPQSEERDPPD